MLYGHAPNFKYLGIAAASSLLMLGSAVHETQVLLAPAWRDVPAASHWPMCSANGPSTA